MTKVVMLLIGDIKYDGRVRKEIASLTSVGVKVELVVTDYGDEESDQDELGVKTHYIAAKKYATPVRNFIENLVFNYKAFRLLRKTNPEFVHCHDLNTLLAGALYKKCSSGKLVYDAHELFPESYGGIREKVWGFIERNCVKSCDVIIMPERNRAQYFKEKYAIETPIKILENFPREIDIDNIEKGMLRKKFAIDDDKVIVLHTGAISPGRHVEELIDAIALSSKDIVLVLLGISWGGYQEVLNEKIAKLD
ncbi:MAG: glycosyltransferase, partial [Pseudomonadales bacterium]